MILLLSYIIKVTSILALVWLFYSIVLKRHTFYTANRWYFLTGIGAAFLLPCLSLPSFAAVNPIIQQAALPLGEWDLIYWLPADSQPAFILLSATGLVLWIIGIGGLIFLLHFCVKLVSFFKLKSRAQIQTIGKTKVFLLQEKVNPFSFLGHIFLNPEMHSETEMAKIIAHEISHIKQSHTIDLILTEVLVIVSWFNPFVWLLRKAMRQNLEYLADRYVLKSGFDMLQYQYILVRTSINGNPGLSIAHNFTFSNLKKRIIMMNKKPSSHMALCKYLLLLPLFAFVWIGVHAGEITKTLNEVTLMQQDKTTVVISSGKDTVKVVLGRLFLNGKEISREELEKNHSRFASMISPDGILSVSVPDSNNSITVISGQSIEIDSADIVRTMTSDPNSNPLYILDGEIITNELFRAINRKTINSITILKNQAAINLYGEQAKNGVISITSKK